MKSKSILVDALTLARFSNLKPTQVDNFKNNVGKGFLPDIWEQRAFGPEQVDGKMAWVEIQGLLRQAWQRRFPLEESVTLITLCAYRSQLARELDEAPDHIKQIPKKYPPEGSENVTKEDLLGLSEYPIEQPALDRISEVWPFQRAVMLLTIDPWRARFCPTCGDRVAAATQRSTRCDNPGCFEESRRATKREAWRRNGMRWRAKAKKTQKKGRGK
jgi:hypothetical protein